MNLSGKKVLVTGADGFICTHLVEGLLDEGCKVKVNRPGFAGIMGPSVKTIF